MFKADSVKPPPGCPKVFAVCPVSLPADTEAALRAGDAAFALVHRSCHVTLTWLHICTVVREAGGVGSVPCIATAWRVLAAAGQLTMAA